MTSYSLAGTCAHPLLPVVPHVEVGQPQHLRVEAQGLEVRVARYAALPALLLPCDGRVFAAADALDDGLHRRAGTT